MSTRALYTFKDADMSVHIYKHHDGYPEGAYEAIDKAIPFAWPLPRFEADEFAAAFVAANKPASDPRFNGGGVRIFGGQIQDADKFAFRRCNDIEYRYEISVHLGRLMVRAFDVDYIHEPKATEMFAGPLDEFKAWGILRAAS